MKLYAHRGAYIRYKYYGMWPPPAATTFSRRDNEAGGDFSDGIPVHVDHGVSDGCLCRACCSPSSPRRHTQNSREDCRLAMRGPRSSHQWYGEKVAPLGHIRFIRHVLLDNTPDCSPAGAHFLMVSPGFFTTTSQRRRRTQASLWRQSASHEFFVLVWNSPCRQRPHIPL